MKYIHCIPYAGGINHSERTRLVVKPDFFDAFANRRHWLEIIWLAAALHLIQLVASVMPGVLWKVTETLQGVAEKSHRFH